MKTRNALSLGVASLVIIVIILIVGFGLYLETALNSSTTTSNHTSATPPSSSTNTVFFKGNTRTTVTYPPTSTYSTFPASGLRLQLSISPSNYSVRLLVFNAEEYNKLNSVNNVSLAKDWKYSQFKLNPYNPCGLSGPVGFAVFQGYYDQTNYTRAKTLPLYNDTVTFACTTTIGEHGSFYSIEPNSDQATFFSSGSTQYPTTLSSSFTTKGYWNNGSFHNFSPGPYTVLGADEWGKIVIVHIVVSSNGSITGTSSYA